jgi:hypothetical protein
MQVVRYHVENVRSYLASHWAVRLFVVPVLALAGALCIAAVATGNAGYGAAILTGAYLAFALAIVAVPLVIERLLGRATGGSLGP